MAKGENKSKKLDPIDHIAIAVKAIQPAVDWYTRTFRCEIEYQDDTWAFLKFDNVRVALVIPKQHPPHIALIRDDPQSYGKLGTHRDGTSSVYINDPSGNSVEIMAPYTVPYQKPGD